MSTRLKKSAARLVFYLVVFNLSINSYAQDTPYTAEEFKSASAHLDKKLEYYKKLYPDILFINLIGGDETVSDLTALDLILGYQPTNLDYEHPPELREDLMYVSVSRIMYMLQAQAPSASLFRADDPAGWPENICVLTIHPGEVAANNTQATNHLLHPTLQALLKIPKDKQLLAEDYLAFVIDHEIYHCLKSMYIGPQLMSDKDLWAEYNNFLDEQAADAYGVLMQFKTREQVSSFPENILRMRGLSLYNADPDHLTCKALQEVINLDPKNITAMNNHEIFELVDHIKKTIFITYDEYIQYLASAIQAIKLIGIQSEEIDDLHSHVADIQPAPALVTELMTNSHRHLKELSEERK